MPTLPLAEPGQSHQSTETSPQATVASVIDDFLSLCGQRYSEESITDRKKVFDEFKTYCGGKLVTTCRPIDLIRWVAAHPAWKSRHTRRGRVSRILAVFNWAARVGLTASNPFRGAMKDALATGSNGDGYAEEGYDPISDESFESLIGGCRNRRLIRMLWFLRDTGCRPKEMRTLTRNEIDRQRSIIVKQQHKTGRNTGLAKIIHLPPRVIEILGEIDSEDRYAGTLDPSGFVFRTARGKPWSKRAFNAEVTRAAGRAGLSNIVPYGCRIGFIERGILSGVNLKLIAAVVGHTSTRMTEHYAARIDRYRTQLTEVASKIAASPLPKRL